MTNRNRPECVVPDCYSPGSHLTECQDYTKCSGCAPGLAMHGLLTCQHHRDLLVRSVEKLPRLHAELQYALAPYRSPQAPRGGGRSADTPDVIDEAAFEHRAAIFEWLDIFSAQVVKILARKRVAADRADPKRPARPPIRGPRRDVPSMARYVRFHADGLCSDPDMAPRAAPRFDRLAREARHVLARSRVGGVYLGACPVLVADSATGRSEPCGGPIRYERPDKVAADDDAWLIECPWCHTKDTVEWWRGKIAGDAPGDAYLDRNRLAMRLSVRLSVAITPSQISKWKFDRRISPAFCDLESKRELYELAEVEPVARKAYGLLEQEAS
jgi:hypothetical protein